MFPFAVSDCGVRAVPRLTGLLVSQAPKANATSSRQIIFFWGLSLRRDAGFDDAAVAAPPAIFLHRR
jgi:hypothetical protein